MKKTGRCAQALLRSGSFGRSVLKQLVCILELCEEETLALVGYFAALHDIGKCAPLFEAKSPELEVYGELKMLGLLHDSLPRDQVNAFRHERYTETVLRRQWEEYAKENKRLWRGIAAALSLHHQGKTGEAPACIRKDCKPDAWLKMQDELEAAMRAEFHPPLDKLTKAANMDALIAYIMGITILADWIASGESEGADDDVAFDKALANRGLAVQDAEMPSGSFCELWPELQRDRLRGVQRCAERAAADQAALYLIEAPMGEGKTEAAVFLAEAQCKAYDKNGFYVALPTSATGNQMCTRMDKLLAGHGLQQTVLMHSMAWMVDRSMPTEAVAGEASEEAMTINKWLLPLRRGMLAQNAVGTVDQAMMAVMPVKYGILRLLGLSGKVLILDEIHAYDMYMETIIEQLLKWCRALEIPVVLLSATLPAEKKRSLLLAYGAKESAELSQRYPLITEVMYDGEVKELPVERVHMHRKYELALYPYFNDASATAKLAIARVETGGCICVMANTVKQAQKIYTEIKQQGCDHALYLFHARFPARQRQDIEEKITSLFGRNAGAARPSKCIVVCTQVMEQSLDVDFDEMITELAPIDLILQRIGRMHRFDDTPRPEDKCIPRLSVLMDANGDYSERRQPIYAELLMKRTAELLKDMRSIHTPEDIRDAVEKVYGNMEDCTDDTTASYLFARDILNSQGRGAAFPDPRKDRSMLIHDDIFSLEDDPAAFRSAKTRLGDSGQRIAVLSAEDMEKAKTGMKLRETARSVMEQSVAVRIDGLGDIPADAVKGEGYLSGCLLLPADEQGVFHWNGNRIYNDPELGTIMERR